MKKTGNDFCACNKQASNYNYNNKGRRCNHCKKWITYKEIDNIKKLEDLNLLLNFAKFHMVCRYLRAHLMSFNNMIDDLKIQHTTKDLGINEIWVSMGYEIYEMHNFFTRNKQIRYEGSISGYNQKIVECIEMSIDKLKENNNI